MDKTTLKMQIVSEQIKARNIKVTFKECLHRAGIRRSRETQREESKYNNIQREILLHVSAKILA